MQDSTQALLTLLQVVAVGLLLQATGLVIRLVTPFCLSLLDCWHLVLLQTPAISQQLPLCTDISLLSLYSSIDCLAIISLKLAVPANPVMCESTERQIWL